MQAKVVGRLLKERSSLTSQKFSLASCLMCACKRGHVKVVELLIQEEAVLLDVKNKNGLKPEEVTQDNAIRELLREEHWRRARSEVWEFRESKIFNSLPPGGAGGRAFGAAGTK